MRHTTHRRGVEQQRLELLRQRGIALYNKGDWEKAAPVFERLVRARFDHGRSLHALGDCYMNFGDPIRALDIYRRSLAIDPTRIGAQENVIFLLDAQPTTTEDSATVERRRWWDGWGRAAYAQRLPYTVTADPDKRLRVGYVSGDYRFHSAAIAFSAVISRHSPAIEPVFYSTLPLPMYDAVTTRQWRDRVGPYFVDVSTMSAETFARVVRDDLVDILVDLSGYTANNRLLSFAYKPAPIQISAWGYATGTDSPTIDMLFADPVVAPTAVRERLHERVVDLPCILSFAPREDLPDVNPLPCLTGAPVFAVYQRASKINEETLATWAEILRRTPESQLVFKGSDYSGRVRGRIAQAMYDVRRQIQFNTSTSHYEHQLWYQAADLSLDPWPQTGGVSSLESAWMGVPTVTLIGPRVIQRTTASILTVLGHEDFIAHSREEYIEKAIRFVTTDREQLAAVRSTLRDTLRASPIVTGYVDAVESTYRELWREYCAKKETEAA